MVTCSVDQRHVCSVVTLAGFQVSRLLQDGPEAGGVLYGTQPSPAHRARGSAFAQVSALQALSFPHSHDFSEGPPPAELIREASEATRREMGPPAVAFCRCASCAARWGFASSPSFCACLARRESGRAESRLSAWSHPSHPSTRKGMLRRGALGRQ